ncbi:MAG: Ger(x)C family spore germination protein [Clostridia bacterium]
MKKNRAIPLITLIIICTCFLTGCWNYREIEHLAIVSGVAVDKYGVNKVLLTVEIVSVQHAQQQATLKPVYIQAAGNTFFEAAKAMIAIQGKRMYWSHAKVIIISEELAKEGISKVLDFINRDAEVREDMWVLLSKGKSAREIFNSKPTFENLVSFEIDDTMRSENSISRYPSIELYEFLDNIGSKETSTTIPTIKLIENRGMTLSYVTGSAIIKKDKLLGYLGETDTRSMLWVQNKIKGGIYAVKNVTDTQTNVSLEILRNKTKIKPEVRDGAPIIKISILTEVNIGEIMGHENFICEKGRKLLEKDAEAQIKKDIEEVIEKAQKEYKSDFLGFGENIKRSMPSVWRSIEKEWNEIFMDIEVSVEVDIRIKGSATTSKPIKVGE